MTKIKSCQYLTFYFYYSSFLDLFKEKKLCEEHDHMKHSSRPPTSPLRPNPIKTVREVLFSTGQRSRLFREVASWDGSQVSRKARRVRRPPWDPLPIRPPCRLETVPSRGKD